MDTKNSIRFVWYNGDVIPKEEAKIDVFSTTAQYGINVFEGIRCYYSEEEDQLFAFRLDDHLERLLNSAKILRFKINAEMNEEYIKSNMVKVVKANNFREDIYVRITLFLDGEGGWSSVEPIRLLISPYAKGRSLAAKEGINSCISTWQRIDDTSIPPRVKTGANYVNSRLGQIEATTNGYDSAIFMNANGKIAEGPGSCIFIIKKNKLITPPVTASILESITRMTIIDIAKNELHLEVEERDIDRTELYISDEIFLCGTAIEIAPVLSIDKVLIKTNEIGLITCRIKDIYFDIVRNKIKKYNKNCWLLPIYLRKD